MAISTPIISGLSTVTREQVETVIVENTNTIPPEPRVTVVNGVLTSISQSPEREGQMLVYVDTSDPLNRIASMYVVVLIGTELSWKIVSNWGVVTDPRTGLPKDPRLDFYSIFA